MAWRAIGKKGLRSSIAQDFLATNRGGGKCLCNKVSDIYVVDVFQCASKFGDLHSSANSRMFHATSSVLAWKNNEEAPYVPPKQKITRKSSDKTVDIFEEITLCELAKRTEASIGALQDIVINVGGKVDSEFDAISMDIAELAAMEVCVNVRRLHSDEGAVFQPRPAVVTVMDHADDVDSEERARLLSNGRKRKLEKDRLLKVDEERIDIEDDSEEIPVRVELPIFVKAAKTLGGRTIHSRVCTKLLSTNAHLGRSWQPGRRTIHSLVCTKLLSTNAHLGRRVAAHHFQVYICGTRNGIAILDSDKILICMRNALHFIGSLVRQKGHFFFLKTNHIFMNTMMEEMVSRISDRQKWRIGEFLKDSNANPKKIRTKKKINLGSSQQPDCVVILDADRESSVIREADRALIPIVSIVDANMPLVSCKRITYPIPANNSMQFIYLFCHLITKTVILERGRTLHKS